MKSEMFIYVHNSQLCGYNYWGVCMLVEYMRQSCMLGATRPLRSLQKGQISHQGHTMTLQYPYQV